MLFAIYSKGTWYILNRGYLNRHELKFRQVPIPNYISACDALNFRLFGLIPVSKLEAVPCCVRCHHLTIKKFRIAKSRNK